MTLYCPELKGAILRIHVVRIRVIEIWIPKLLAIESEIYGIKCGDVTLRRRRDDAVGRRDMGCAVAGRVSL